MTKLLGYLALALALAAPAAAQDAFDLHGAEIVNAPNVADWPARATITSLSFDGSTTRVAFTKYDGPDRWPDVVPAGWTGPLQYTLWLCLQNGGQWACSAFIQFWHGRDGSGSPTDPDVPSVYDKHWYYASRWSPLFGHGPIHSSEPIGFLVTSGNERDNAGPFSVQERSNVVVVPATDRGSFTFGAPPPVVTPPPIVTPPPVVVPPVVQPPAPTLDLSGVYAQLAMLNAKVDAVNQNVSDARAENKTFFDHVKSVWATIGEPLLKYVAPAVGAYFVGKKL